MTQKVYIQTRFEEGDLITQDGNALITQGEYIDVDLVTQSLDTLLTQEGDTLVVAEYDETLTDNIGYKDILTNRIYNPTINQRVYGN